MVASSLFVQASRFVYIVLLKSNDDSIVTLPRGDHTCLLQLYVFCTARIKFQKNNCKKKTHQISRKLGTQIFLSFTRYISSYSEEACDLPRWLQVYANVLKLFIWIYKLKIKMKCFTVSQLTKTFNCCLEMAANFCTVHFFVIS